MLWLVHLVCVRKFNLELKDKIHFAATDNSLKFPLGPIVSPKPGPTLEMHVAAAEIAVSKSRPVNDNNKDTKKNIKKYKKIKAITEETNCSPIFSLL